MKCVQCGERLRRVHRTFFERFSYMAVYECRTCKREEFARTAFINSHVTETYVQARGVRPAPLPLPFWPVLPLPAVWHVPGSTPQTARQDRPHAWRVSELPGTPDLERPPVSLPLVPAAILRSARAGDPTGCRPTPGPDRKSV